jgi:hypothetical protein
LKIPPAARKRSINKRKNGRNFIKSPMKKPAAKKIMGFIKLSFFLFKKITSFSEVLYDILCKI